MIRRLQLRLYRFLHGEDVFDAWPTDTTVVDRRPATRAVRPARHIAAHR